MDKFNHASWLTMMENRLKIAKNLLKDDGVIFISIDDNEQANLKLLCDEIFGAENFVANLIWQKKKGGSQDSQDFAKEHEYILCYKKENWNIKDELQKHDISDFTKIVNGKNAKLMKLEKWGNHSLRSDRPTLYYSIKDPKGNDFYPIAPNGKDGCWRKKPENLDENHIFWQENSKGRLTPYEVIYFDEVDTKVVKTRTIFTEYGTTTDATKEILSLFGNQKIFDTPKPEKLLQKLIKILTNPNDIVMDFFAGSGTTAAALKMGRKFICVEMGDHFENVIIPRIKKSLVGFERGILDENINKGGIKYYTFESFENTLKRADYSSKNSESYPLFKNLFLFDDKFANALKENDGKFSIALDEIYKNIDLKESILNFTGKKVEFLSDEKVKFKGDDKGYDLAEILKDFLIW